MAGLRQKGRIDASAKAREVFLDGFAKGLTVEDALLAARRSRKTYEYWRSKHADFVRAVEVIKTKRARPMETEERDDLAQDFPSFCRTYLHHDLYPHQLQWLDLLEGRPPRDMHPSMVYQAGRPELVVINTPPEHAKSTTITMDYVTYRICRDPNVRVVIVSKTQAMAKKFVYGVKTRLTHPRYQKLIADFAPAEGFAKAAIKWSEDQVYLGSETRDSGEKDPTLLALGIGSHIYGARADLIVVDDAADLANAHEYEKQIDWLSQEVMSRLSDESGREGVMLIVGTRVAPLDLYSELLRPERWPDGHCEYTYFAQPAVLEFADDPRDWVTLWPLTDKDGVIHGKWDGVKMHRRRAVVPPRTWAMVYQQQQVHEEAIFPAAAVKASVQHHRGMGRLTKDDRPQGMEGLFVVAGLDPASAGYTAIVVLGIDRETKKRWVLEVRNEAGMSPYRMRQSIKDLTAKYAIHEWRIEKNAFQTMLTQDPEVRQFLAERGVVLKEHHTGSNKWDEDFGVSSMASLFEGHDENRQKISLPSGNHEAIKQMVEQLIVWSPGVRNRSDIVMALWFAEIRARETLRNGPPRYHMENKYLPRRARGRRAVINLDDLWAARQAG